ncbi:3-oxoacyl-[acyl-carrier protein] reductase [Arboricoccus pini]|uniref:3-oxoacyl-[acyl-carrier protein] reductase n=1 Tax=Arboricoccus pini TaxID=1963835 RepID=A0A212RHN4_9PROT|nr:SDR family oxidoreductase [Arboricoccus pini]SNB71926.1 3-oxoacyl-[acyl-carrier protein] reductase [Arboricoccus pini]
MDLGLAGLRALVTGGSKGIGRASALTLAQEGCGIAICARNQAEIDSVVAAAKAKGVPAIGQSVDVSKKEALTAWIAASAEALGGIDILVLNVSALDMGQGEEAWQAEFEIDLMHTVRALEAALPHLERSAHPAVIIVSSVSGLEFDFTSAAYGTFKAALIHYASRMASALAEKHIRVNTVSPGNTYFEGGIWQRIEREMPDLFKTAMGLNPFGRMATDQEIANAVVFLASPASSFTTGVNLVVDGALTRRVQY